MKVDIDVVLFSIVKEGIAEGFKVASDRVNEHWVCLELHVLPLSCGVNCCFFLISLCRFVRILLGPTRAFPIVSRQNDNRKSSSCDGFFCQFDRCLNRRAERILSNFGRYLITKEVYPSEGQE